MNIDEMIKSSIAEEVSGVELSQDRSEAIKKNLIARIHNNKDSHDSNFMNRFKSFINKSNVPNLAAIVIALTIIISIPFVISNYKMLFNNNSKQGTIGGKNEKGYNGVEKIEVVKYQYNSNKDGDSRKIDKTIIIDKNDQVKKIVDGYKSASIVTAQKYPYPSDYQLTFYKKDGSREVIEMTFQKETIWFLKENVPYRVVSSQISEALKELLQYEGIDKNSETTSQADLKASEFQDMQSQISKGNVVVKSEVTDPNSIKRTFYNTESLDKLITNYDAGMEYSVYIIEYAQLNNTVFINKLSKLEVVGKKIKLTAYDVHSDKQAFAADNPIFFDRTQKSSQSNLVKYTMYTANGKSADTEFVVLDYFLEVGKDTIIRNAADNITNMTSENTSKIELIKNSVDDLIEKSLGIQYGASNVSAAEVFTSEFINKIKTDKNFYKKEFKPYKIISTNHDNLKDASASSFTVFVRVEDAKGNYTQVLHFVKLNGKFLINEIEYDA